LLFVTIYNFGQLSSYAAFGLLDFLSHLAVLDIFGSGLRLLAV
jgi:hypothetical protein